ncbi:DUF305 domain-containing protein [Serinicoccus sp. LYQ131]|uniref:DUF305 domain-containing protein n=1 Tax=Serinicoccus sp. LYQ131 TaxID=3378797 RepID=UPI003854A134
MKRITRTFSVPALALSTLFTVSACGGDATDDPTSGSPAAEADTAAEEHNDADVQFASGMIPHHQQAVTMSDMALEQGGPEVIDLAERIQAAQGPEIETMTGWLETWGEEVPEDIEGMDHMDHMDHMDMEGMMTPEDMDALMNAEGTQFDTMWLEMMIEHHNGAITMSEDQMANGQNPEAIDLAESIAESQNAEIAEMEELQEAATS